MEHYVPYTPQQNGVVERKNRALKEMDICMLEDKCLSPKICYDAINYAAYVQNKFPHKELEEKTPFEAWSGHKPNVSHFRVFGSKAWDRIPLEKRNKLQLKIKDSLIVGIFEYAKGYKLLLGLINPPLSNIVYLVIFPKMRDQRACIPLHIQHIQP